MWFVGLSVLLTLLSMAGPVLALKDRDPFRVVSIITTDEHGSEIAYPQALHFDRFANEIYVVSSTGRITLYDHRYFPVASFGKGRGLVAPQGVTVDAEGNIYICNGRLGSEISPRISVFSPAFFKVRDIVFAEIPGMEGYEGSEIAVSAAGNLYVIGADRTGEPSGIAVLGNNGNFLRWLKPVDHVWREVKEKREDDLYPVLLRDIAIDKNGRIYVVSAEVSRVYVYNEKEEFLFQFGEKGGVKRKLSTPVSVAVDPDRQIVYVVDYMRHTVLCYDSRTGRFIFEFGGRGNGPLWFNFPNRIEVDGHGRVLVSDLHNRRVQVIDTSIAVQSLQASLLPIRIEAVAQPEEVEEVAEVEPEKVVDAPPQIADPEEIIAPGQVDVVKPGVPVPPEQLAGLDVSFSLPAASTEIPLQRAPELVLERPRELPPKQIMAKRMKKKVQSQPSPALPLAMIIPAEMPGRVVSPAEVKAVPALDALVSNKGQGWRGRIRSLPSALAVYGPVASLIGIGSWLLYTKR